MRGLNRQITVGRFRWSQSYRARSVVLSPVLMALQVHFHLSSCRPLSFPLSLCSLQSVSSSLRCSLAPLISSLALLSPVSSLLSHARQQKGGMERCFVHHWIGRRPLTLEAGDGPGYCRLFLVFSGDFLGAFCPLDSSAIWGKFLGEISVRKQIGWLTDKAKNSITRHGDRPFQFAKEIHTPSGAWAFHIRNRILMDKIIHST